MASRPLPLSSQSSAVTTVWRAPPLVPTGCQEPIGAPAAWLNTMTPLIPGVVVVSELVKPTATTDVVPIVPTAIALGRTGIPLLAKL